MLIGSPGHMNVVMEITGATKLRSLDLSYCKLEDFAPLSVLLGYRGRVATARILVDSNARSYQGLEKLVLTGNRPTDASFIKFCSVLASSKVLSHLTLTNNGNS
jgi:Leucine-rich repeat (LRR) protein